MATYDVVTREEMLRRIRGEFLEMPGLCLTAPQAQRLWGLDRGMCDQLLRELVTTGFLSITRDGAFVLLRSIA